MDDLTPVTVTARLQAGAVLDVRWPLPLDSLLAWVAIRRQLGEQARAPLTEADQPVEPDLPLARWTAPCGDWVWQASCAQPDQTGEQVIWYHRRFPFRRAEQAARLPPVIRANNPRLAARMPIVSTVCAQLTWQAVGHPARISDLLATVGSVGAKTGSGHGAVIGWDVTPTRGVDLALWGLVDEDGRPARPLPATAGPSGVRDAPAGATVAGARPPYWHPHMWRQIHPPETIMELTS